jgi:nitrate reductase NapE component
MSLRRLVRRLRFAKPANETQTFAKHPPTPSPSEAKLFAREARVVFAVLSLSAVTAFAIQAWMTFGFAKEVWGMPVELCFALVFALDVFAVMWMILSYLLRNTGWPRFIAFVVFLFAIGAQVLAAEMFGAHRGWSEEVRWFSAVPALLLALSQEGVILWRTYRSRRMLRTQPPATVAPPAVTREPRKTTTTPPVPPAPRPPAPAATAAPAGGKRETARAEHDKVAQRVIAGQVTKEQAATDTGKSIRAVELWIADYRKRHPAGPQLGTFQLPAPTVNPQVNGTARQEVN